MFERSISSLYIDTVKHLRVIRGVVKSHKEACGVTEIDLDRITPYERGRLTRSCTRVGNNLVDLCKRQQHSMVVYFAAYVEALGTRPGVFSKPGANHWCDLFCLTSDMYDSAEIDPTQVPVMVGMIGSMLDEPLAKVPNRVTLMRLSIP
jgi:hypothetical protein